MDVDAIIKGLSEAQKRAVLALTSFNATRTPLFRFVGEYRDIKAVTLNALLERDLIWGRENYSSRVVWLSPTGLAVRARLMGEG